MISPFPSRWMVLYKWWQGKLSAFFKAKAERSLGCYFQGHFRELSLIRVSFVALGIQSHVNQIISLQQGLVGVSGRTGTSVVPLPLELGNPRTSGRYQFPPPSPCLLFLSKPSHRKLEGKDLEGKT